MITDFVERHYRCMLYRILLSTVAHCYQPPPKSAMIYYHILPLTGQNDFVYTGLNAQNRICTRILAQDWIGQKFPGLDFNESA